MSLEARFRLERGGFVLDVELHLPLAGVTSLFGPSGSGKTSLLRCLAGLERADPGRLVVGGERWQDGPGCFLPPWRRRVGYVFQEAELFPHLDVEGNLAFGLRRTPPRERRFSLEQVCAWLGLEALRRRAPATLSGGERQRVAIGRALLASPRLLLMDEPVSALDETGRQAVLTHLQRLASHIDVPIVYVSHALREVARLCDRMVWLDDGRVRAQGSVAELLASPELARAEGEGVGAVLRGTVVAHDSGDALTELAVPGGRFYLPRLARPQGEQVRVHVLARDVSLALDPEPRSSILNVLEARVEALHEDGPGQVLVRLELGTTGQREHLLARITARSARTLHLGPGVTVFARVKAVGLLE